MAVRRFSQGSKQISKSFTGTSADVFTLTEFLETESGVLQKGFKISGAKNVACGVEIENAVGLSCTMKVKVFFTDRDSGDYLSTTEVISTVTEPGITILSINSANLGFKYVDIEVTVTAGSGDFTFLISGND